MKNSKKTWGILGTSMGSMLIIVALLTMVGMGSSDTYAACKCPTGYNPTATGCYREVHTTGCSDSACQARTGVPVGRKYGNCTTDSAGIFSCTIPEYADCEDDDDDQPCLDCGGGTDKPGHNCEAGQFYSGTAQSCQECPEGSYCPGVYWPDDDTFKGDAGKFDCPSNKQKGQSKCGNDDDNDDKPTGGDDDETGDGSTCSKAGDPCTLNGKSGKCQASGDGFTCKVPKTPSGGDDKPNNPNAPTGGGDGGSGGNGGGGNSGGNSGGNGNGGNAGGNNGNNNGGNNTTKNPNTATKAPLAIAIIGIISVGISSVVYFKGKKEINTEI